MMTIDCQTNRSSRHSRRCRSDALVLAIVVALAASAGQSASAMSGGDAADKLDRALTGRITAAESGDVRVIIQSSGDLTTVKQRVEALGGRMHAQHKLIHAF